MKILQINATHGPNYWSIERHHLVVMLLDIEELEDRPTNDIKGFYHRLKKVFPGLYEHRCSEGLPGGFFTRVERGTWMGHVIEHIALELQILAGLDVSFGQARGAGKRGQYYVVLDCIEEESGRLAAEKAVGIAMELIDGYPTQKINKHVDEIRHMYTRNMPGPSTASILREAKSRNIPAIKLEDSSTYQLGYGCYQKRIAATILSSTSHMAVDLACDKEICRNTLQNLGVPVPQGNVVYSLEELQNLIPEIGFPLVIKPVTGNQGRGVTTNIETTEGAIKAFQFAKKISNGIIAERQVSGNDYRVLTINYKFVAAAKRTPPHVVGDGEHTIRQLINLINKDSCRGEGHEKSLTKISVGLAARSILKNKGYTVQTVLSPGEMLYLDYAANLSKGGTAEDVTDHVHPEVAAMAERISRIVGLDVCGIDVMAPTLNLPLKKTEGAILEVNAAPGLRMHLSPSKGKGRNVAAPVLDMLFPAQAKSRIPITAVTGTNGKTTTTRLISHILQTEGYRVGYTTTDGIYINNQLMLKGDCTGPRSAEFILKDPNVNVAVLECARGGIIRSGLGFDQCGVAVVLNVSSDHLGLRGIHTLEKMAKLKSVVPESVHKKGYAVLNADDDRVYEMREHIRGTVALFSLDKNNLRLRAHREAGGICVLRQDHQIVIWDGESTHIVENFANIPLSFGGRAIFMIENILAAVAAAYVQKISFEKIRTALQSFIPSPDLTPGRMNIFNFENFDVMVDYAHNAAAMKALKKFLTCSSYSYKIGIVAAIGDRRMEDNMEVGRISAEIFDSIIIREDVDLRGKLSGETSEIIKEGIARSGYNPPVKLINNEQEALLFAMRNAPDGALIAICVDQIDELLDFVKTQQAAEKKRSGSLRKFIMPVSGIL